MSHFVLVHGSWHGAWCWERVVPLLEAAGHTALAIDLPGHGEDHTPIHDVSLASYAERVCDVVAEQVAPVTLVGHSMGGNAISQAASRVQERVTSLVHLASIITPPGESIVELASTDRESLVTRNVVLDPVSGTAHLDEAAMHACFYDDCAAEDLQHAYARVRPDPLVPLMTPAAAATPSEAEGSASSIPASYIECLKDRAVTPEMQRSIHRRAGCQRVYTMDTSHSPFFSAPADLVAHLIAASEGHSPR